MSDRVRQGDEPAVGEAEQIDCLDREPGPKLVEVGDVVLEQVRLCRAGAPAPRGSTRSSVRVRSDFAEVKEPLRRRTQARLGGRRASAVAAPLGEASREPRAAARPRRHGARPASRRSSARASSGAAARARARGTPARSDAERPGQRARAHCQRQREHEDDERRPERRRERQEAVGGERDGSARAASSYRSAARSARTRCARPRRGESPLLDGGDRAVLGPVEVKRTASQNREEQHERERDSGGRRPPAGDEGESQWGDHCREDQPALARGGNAARPQDGRERRPEANEAARERKPLEHLRWIGHPPFAEGAVDARERPAALADDHNAVRARHAAQPGKDRAASARRNTSATSCTHSL